MQIKKQQVAESPTPEVKPSMSAQLKQRTPVLQTLAAQLNSKVDRHLPSADPRIRGSRIQDPRLVPHVTVQTPTSTSTSAAASISDSIEELQKSIYSVGSIASSALIETKPELVRHESATTKKNPSSKYEPKNDFAEITKGSSDLSKTSLMSLIKSTVAIETEKKSKKNRKSQSGKSYSKRSESPKKLSPASKKVDVNKKSGSQTNIASQMKPKELKLSDSVGDEKSETIQSLIQSKLREKSASPKLFKQTPRSASPKHTKKVGSSHISQKIDQNSSKKLPRLSLMKPKNKTAFGKADRDVVSHKAKTENPAVKDVRDNSQQQKMSETKESRHRNYRTNRDRESESPEPKLHVRIPNKTYFRADTKPDHGRSHSPNKLHSRSRSPHSGSRSPRNSSSVTREGSDEPERWAGNTRRDRLSVPTRKGGEGRKWRDKRERRKRRGETKSDKDVTGSEQLANVSDISSDELNEGPPDKRLRAERIEDGR